MVDQIVKTIVGIGVAIGLKTAGKALGPLAPITSAAGIVMTLDEGMRKQVAEDVIAANTSISGAEPNIFLISDFNGSQGKSFLEEIVKKRGGGTAWYQASRNRMECFWHNSKSFSPKPVKDQAMGYIVHGPTDGR
ncbi:MAG: hypothetical protein ACTHNN_19620 [Xanthobacteraceae bacterium]